MLSSGYVGTVIAVVPIAVTSSGMKGCISTPVAFEFLSLKGKISNILDELTLQEESGGLYIQWGRKAMRWQAQRKMGLYNFENGQRAVYSWQVWIGMTCQQSRQYAFVAAATELDGSGGSLRDSENKQSSLQPLI